MSFFAPQNPGISGLSELTNAEELFLTTFASLTYNEGDVLTIVSGDLTWAPPTGGGGGSATITEVEIDFGTTPVRSKRFTVIDAAITSTKKIIATPSGSIATGRVGDDYEWDSISYSCKSEAGQFVLTGIASGKIIGKRKIYYTTT